MRTQMDENEVMIHVDFSENYITKQSAAIQSAHFGASQNQITIHTGVYYVGANSKPYTFGSISDSMEHGPAAIWTHLEPVLDEIELHFPSVNVIHFFSDGPHTSQYRQKLNFYMFSKVVRERKFKLGTWNFLEAGHGKGAPDGVGSSN